MPRQRPFSHSAVIKPSTVNGGQAPARHGADASRPPPCGAGESAPRNRRERALRSQNPELRPPQRPVQCRRGALPVPELPWYRCRASGNLKGGRAGTSAAAMPTGVCVRLLAGNRLGQLEGGGGRGRRCARLSAELRADCRPRPRLDTRYCTRGRGVHASRRRTCEFTHARACACARTKARTKARWCKR